MSEKNGMASPLERTGNIDGVCANISLSRV
jgi:hypothetical protein